MKHKKYDKTKIYTCKVCKAIAYMKIEDGRFREIEIMRCEGGDE